MDERNVFRQVHAKTYNRRQLERGGHLAGRIVVHRLPRTRRRRRLPSDGHIHRQTHNTIMIAQSGLRLETRTCSFVNWSEELALADEIESGYSRSANHYRGIAAARITSIPDYIDMC